MTMPVPGAIRPVPNKLFIVNAQTTALPSRSSVANVVEAGRAGRGGADGTAAPLSRDAGLAPPARNRAATSKARVLAAWRSDGERSNVW